MSELKKYMIYGLSLIFWVNVLSATFLTMPIGFHESLAILLICATGIICFLRTRDTSKEIYYTPLIVYEGGLLLLAIAEISRDYYSFLEALIQNGLLGIVVGIFFFLPQILEFMGIHDK